MGLFRISKSHSGFAAMAFIVCAVYWFVPVVRYFVLKSLWESPSIFYVPSKIHEFMLLVSAAPGPFIAQTLCCAASWFVLVMVLRFMRCSATPANADL